MNRNLSRAIVFALLGAAAGLLWLGGGWAWRELLRLHGVH